MRILIVDDEPLARNELKYLVNKTGQHELVDEADSIEETLTALLREQYDLLFLDINLINESGLTLAEKINKMKAPSTSGTWKSLHVGQKECPGANNLSF